MAEIIQHKLDTFIQLSGDNSLLHTNKEFALKKGYDGIVVHGMLTGSFYSQLIGIHLPGQNGYSQEYKISFIAPVYVGDILTIYGEIEFINEALRQIWITAYITNQNDLTVSRAKIKAGFF